MRVDWMRLPPPGRSVARGGGRSQRLTTVRAAGGPALVREEPDDLRRLMIGQAEPITNDSQLVALFGADRAARKDPADRLLELQPPLVQPLAAINTIRPALTSRPIRSPAAG